MTLISKFNKVAAYKMNIQKSVALLYINNKLSKKQIKTVISFLNIGKKPSQLGMNFTKYTKHFYNEYHKTLMKNIKRTK